MRSQALVLSAVSTLPLDSEDQVALCNLLSIISESDGGKPCWSVSATALLHVMRICLRVILWWESSKISEHLPTTSNYSTKPIRESGTTKCTTRSMTIHDRVWNAPWRGKHGPLPSSHQLLQLKSQCIHHSPLLPFCPELSNVARIDIRAFHSH